MEKAKKMHETTMRDDNGDDDYNKYRLKPKNNLPLPSPPLHFSTDVCLTCGNVHLVNCQVVLKEAG